MKSIQNKLESFGVNVHLMWAKLSFLLFYGGNSCLIPFLSVYYHDIGLSGAEVGLIRTLRPLIGISSPLIAMVADATRQHKLICLLSIFLSTIVRFFILYAGNNLAIILIISAVSEFINAPAFALTNNAVLIMLGDRKEDYGKQRLWGAVGWGSFSLVIGLLVTSTNDYAWAFYTFLISVLLSVPITAKLKFTPDEEKVAKKTPFLQSAKLLVTNWQNIIVLLVYFVMGCANGFHATYLFLFLQQLGGTEFLMGLSLAVTCISEVPFFFYSGWLIKKFSPHGVLQASLFCYAVRLLYYSLLTNPWAVLPAEILHGITFAAFWAAGVAIISDNSPPELSATAQGLLASVYNGVGTGIGTLIGGLFYETLGPRVLFLASSGSLFVCFVMFVVATCCKSKKDQTEEDKEVLLENTDNETNEIEQEMNDVVVNDGKVIEE